MAKNHDFSLDKWLDGLGLSAAERTTVASAINADPTRVAYIRDSQLAQSDYAFHMDELKTKIADEERYLKELDTWKGDQSLAIQQAHADVAKARGEVAAYAEYLRTQGVDPATLGLPAAATATPATAESAKPADIDTSKYMTRDQGLAVAEWAILSQQLDREHQRLFGQPMDGMKLFNEIKKSTDDPTTVFNRIFNADQRRAEMAEADIQTRIEQARKDERIKVQSEISVGRYAPTNPVGGVAPVIHQFGQQGKTNGDAGWQQEAMADFQRRQATHATE